MSDERRKCEVIQPEQVIPKIEGYFLGIHPVIFYDEGNHALPDTAAFVESLDGRILKVSPTKVRFIARFQNEYK
jgi:hypothetical protein